MGSGSPIGTRGTAVGGGYDGIEPEDAGAQVVLHLQCLACVDGGQVTGELGSLGRVGGGADQVLQLQGQAHVRGGGARWCYMLEGRFFFGRGCFGLG